MTAKRFWELYKLFLGTDFKRKALKDLFISWDGEKLKKFTEHAVQLETSDIKNLKIQGVVAARNESDVEVYKKDGGSYYVHSFILKVTNQAKKFGKVQEVEDYIAFKTVQTNVICAFKKGHEVLVRCSMDGRPWMDGDEYVIKEYNGTEEYKCFTSFYAYGVDVLNTFDQEHVEDVNNEFDFKNDLPY